MAGFPAATPSTAGAAAVMSPEAAGLKPEELQAYMVQRLYEAESRATALEANLDRAVSDLNQMRDKAQSLIGADGPAWGSHSNNHDGDDFCESSVGAIQRLSLTEDEAYFSSYADFTIHAEMLQDKVRSESYRDFIFGNPEVFRDKIVLDIGCGTGILSMFAAKAGAKHVISVDQSEIIYRAMDIARENGLDKQITFLKGRMEDVKLPYDKVDVIISEWMGYFLLFESMLDTVIVARNQHLAPGGHVYPDKCSIWLAGFTDAALRAKIVDFWDDVYGFKMSCMKSEVVSQTGVDITGKDKVITNPCVIKELDVDTCSLTDVDFAASFSLTCCKDAVLHGLVGYFDIGFEAGCSKKIHFSTGPNSTSTHWKQTQFLLKTPLEVKKGSKLDGSIAVKKNKKDPRSLDIRITLDGTTQDFYMD